MVSGRELGGRFEGLQFGKVVSKAFTQSTKGANASDGILDE